MTDLCHPFGMLSQPFKHKFTFKKGALIIQIAVLYRDTARIRGIDALRGEIGIKMFSFQIPDKNM